MVAKIDTNSRLDKTLNYNEKKVQQETAHLIYASGFLKDQDRLNFYEKMERFERQNELNPASQVNTLHAKVSFDPSEKETLTDAKMVEIAKQYMEGIGFKDQPYLVYRHNDTAAPHFHIVSTMIQPDGSRIRDFNIGKEKSEPTREAIEERFGLVKASDHKQVEEYSLKPVDLEAIIHGEKPTKQAMQNTLEGVVDKYNVSSLAELNAVLRQFNMVADPGAPGSRTREHNGLIYKVVDPQGNTIGLPIRASDFSFKPTLENLNEKFREDGQSRAEYLRDVREKISAVNDKQPGSLGEYLTKLKEQNIDVIVWQRENGQIRGMTYVDHDKKISVKGSDLGKEFGGKALSDRFDVPGTIQKAQQSHSQTTQPGDTDQTSQRPTSKLPTASADPQDGFNPGKSGGKQIDNPGEGDWNFKAPQVLSNLIKHKQDSEDLPVQLKKDKKQQRRHRL